MPSREPNLLPEPTPGLPMAQPGARLATVLQVIREGVQLWDGDGRLIFANPASASQFGPQAMPRSGECWSDWIRRCATFIDCDGGAEAFPLKAVLHGGSEAVERLIRIDCSEGRSRWLRFDAHGLPGAEQPGADGAVSFTRDVTELLEQEQRLLRQAHYDALTGLPNRVLLTDRMSQALARSLRNEETLAICLLDLDGFKAVNDSLGHKAGDQLLQEVSSRLLESIRAQDTVARLGGDEFALLLEGFKTSGQCEHILKRILDSVAAPCMIGPDEVRVSASIGVTLFPGDAHDADQLLRHADQAMYKAKQAGKNRFCIFDPTVESRAKANLGLLNKIEKALERQQFCLYYQPKVDCRAGQVVGLEALLRWQHPILGVRAPGEFLPLIEHDDLIIRLGDWVIAEALEQLERLRQAGFPITISVNVPARQFLRGDFEHRLEALLAPHDPALASLLEIEIVETAALEDISLVSRLVSQYHRRGVKFALDDFGTGFSSLVHLKRLAADILKIDQTFVRDMLADPGDLAIVQGVIGLAAAFQRQVIAEGVETIEHILMLLELGCDVMQGYGIARPMPSDRVVGWLTEFRADPRWRVARSGYPTHGDFDLLLMEVAHCHWLETLLRQLTQGQPGPGGGDLAACRLMDWCQDVEIRSQFGHLAEFREIDTAHRRVHEVAAALRATAASDPLANLVEGTAVLQAAHAELILRLHAFRLAQGRESVTRQRKEK